MSQDTSDLLAEECARLRAENLVLNRALQTTDGYIDTLVARIEADTGLLRRIRTVLAGTAADASSSPAVQALLDEIDQRQRWQASRPATPAATVPELPATQELRETIEDTLEWLKTGKVDGVGFCEQSLIEVLERRLAPQAA